MENVLVTGAAGAIGTRLRSLLRGAYPRIRWSDIREPDNLEPDEEFMLADLTDTSAVAKLVDGIDGIIHLGGFGKEGSWDDILNADIIGCYNIFEAAYRADVKRVVFASSNHAVGFYPRSATIPVDVTVRPDSRYGIGKAFGEAVGAFYADKHGLGVTCIRIGYVGDFPIGERYLSIWQSPEDFVQLVRIGLEHPAIQFEIFYGVSDNPASWWDNSNASRFGYRPTGNANNLYAEEMKAQAKLPPDPVGDQFQGGVFCSNEYDADKR